MEMPTMEAFAMAALSGAIDRFDETLSRFEGKPREKPMAEFINY